MNYAYSYAVLGNSCQNNGDVITSNAKFLPLKTEEYNSVLTKHQQYPTDHKNNSVVTKNNIREKDNTCGNSKK
jgi:hypothetical protein